MSESNTKMSSRFRGYLPVIVDLETAGFNAETDALLEMAVVIPAFNKNGNIGIESSHREHIVPFEGANLDPAALEFNGIDPYHPFRLALDEKTAITQLFKPVRQAIKDQGCTRAILVGHNPAFDIGFMNAAVNRAQVKRNPFHPFSTFDTATLGGLAYGQTVLARVAQAAGIEWDNEQAHSALYDAEQTAFLFCKIVNHWDELSR
ncbi:MAG: ribonuclease T [Cycloclasticus sp. symbiont of Poecilosclerida sp. M]|nr:MAG: ribonuclease T [Cycloclasticus sp. symbiont of Poecilosclerida sp. M]